jgi:hypothetical protein
LTISSIAVGDVTGPFSNLQIAANAVGTTEIADGSVTGAKIAQGGAVAGDVLVWNGTTWVPVTPPGDNFWNDVFFGPNVVHNRAAINQVVISKVPGSTTIESGTVLTVDGQDATKAATFKTTNTSNDSRIVEIINEGTASDFVNPTALYIENEPFLDSGNGIEVHAGGTGATIEGGLQGVIGTSVSNLGAGGIFSGSVGAIGTGQFTGVLGGAEQPSHGSVGVSGRYNGNGSFNGVGVEGFSVPEEATIPFDKGFGIGGRFTGGNKGIWASRTTNPNSNYLLILNTYDSLYGSRNLPMAGYFTSESSVGLFAESQGTHIVNNALPGIAGGYGTGIVGVHKGDIGVNSRSIGVLGVSEGTSLVGATTFKAGVMGYSKQDGIGQSTGVYGYGEGGSGGFFDGTTGVLARGETVAVWGQASPTGSAAWFENYDPANPANITEVINAGLNNRAGLISNTNTVGTGNTLRVTNAGNLSSFLGSAETGQVAVDAVMTNENGGLFTSAVRGLNQSLTGSGIGVSGIHKGSGWGLHGVSESGFGLYAISNSDVGASINTGATNGTALITNGKVGVRTNNPGAYAMRIRQTDAQFGLSLQNAEQLTDWEIYVGTGDPAQLNFLQTATAGGFAAWLNSSGLITTSDQRLKKNWVTLPSVLSDVKKLNPVTYEMVYETSGKRYTGFLAQDVQKLFPTLVEENNLHGEQRLGLNYGAMSVVAIKAIQEQQTIIETQQKTLDEQAQQIQKLEQEMAEMKAMMRELMKK